MGNIQQNGLKLAAHWYGKKFKMAGPKALRSCGGQFSNARCGVLRKSKMGQRPAIFVEVFFQ